MDSHRDWVLLAPLSDEDRREFFKAAHRRRFRKGETIFHEGDPGDTVHLIDKGHVAMKVTAPRGDVATLLVDGPGSFFGELALFSASAQRNAKVIALDATETLSLHRTEFDVLRERHRGIDQVLIAALGAQVQRLSKRLAEAHFLPADVRIYRRIVELEKVFGGDPPTSIPLTQDDLASLAGTTRPTVNGVLRSIQDAGAVKLGRGTIEVLDLSWLEHKSRA